MKLSDFVSIVSEFDNILSMLDKELYFYVSEDDEKNKVNAIKIESVGCDSDHIFLAGCCPYCDK